MSFFIGVAVGAAVVKFWPQVKFVGQWLYAQVVGK